MDRPCAASFLPPSFLPQPEYANAAPKGDGVALALDEVHTLTFKNPIATVYVGNPAIADVTMIDARHAFVQGKGYGRTNIVALDRENTRCSTPMSPSPAAKAAAPSCSTAAPSASR